MWPVVSSVRLVVWLGTLWLHSPAIVSSSGDLHPESHLYKARPDGIDCPNCHKPKEFKDIKEGVHLEIVKQQLLDGIGIKNPQELTTNPGGISPNFQTHIVPSEPDKDEDVDDLLPDLVSKAEPPDGIKDKNVIQFDLHNQTNENADVRGASLFVYLKKRNKKNKGNKRITLKISTVDEKGKPKKLLTSLKIRLKSSRWGELGLPADLLKDALKHPNSPLKLHIRCKKCKRFAKPIMALKSPRRRKSRKGRRRRISRKSVLNGKRPLLVVRRRAFRTRSKRHTQICPRSTVQHFNSGNNTDINELPGCCKKSYFLNFTKIGWGDWIISPEGTILSYCQGRCANRRSSSNDTTTHDDSDRGRRQRNRQCQPTRKTHLVIFYFDQSLQIVEKRIRNFTVTNCGCRATQ